MLDALRKTMGKASADTQLLAEIETYKEQLSSKSQELSSIVEQLTDLTTRYEQLESQFAAANLKLAQAEEFNKAMEDKIAQERTDKRMTKLKALVGDIKAASMMCAIGGLDDNSFDSVCEGLKTTYEMEAESFKEVGAGGEAKPTIDPTAALIAAKYTK